MNKETPFSKLVWKEENRKKVFDCRVFSVYESYCKSPDNDELKTFSILDAADWAIVVPVLETSEGKKFVMVRQWRHGAQSISLEFPGGVFEHGENPQDAAARELLEETGYKATIRKLGEFSPNPAIMANRVHIFLAEDLVNTGCQHLDEDEFVAVELISIEEVIQGMGKPPYIHALMGSALALYYRSGS